MSVLPEYVTGKQINTDPVMDMEVRKLAIREEDIMYMKMALEEAVKGIGFTNPNPMVGAVIVKDGKVLAKGYHHCCGQGHAEVEAFRAAGDADVTGATIYVTLEPCSHYGKTPPCADLIVSKKVGRVVVAALDPNPLVAGRGIRRIREAGIEVETGVLAEESCRLNEIFMTYITRKEPFVLYKSAMSLDGKIAAPNGESQWISCEESREQVQKLRNQYMAIMVGIGTVLADDPMLTCRISGGKDPVRIVVDSALRTPVESKLVRSAGDVPLIIACHENASKEKEEILAAKGARIIRAGLPDGRVDLKALVRILGQEGIDSILLEGGGTLAFAAFEAGIIDKVQFYIAPKIIGGTASMTPLGGPGIAHLKEAWALKELSAQKVGEDICLTGYVIK